MEILQKKINSTATNHLKKPIQIFKIASSKTKECGSSMIELLLATVVALVAASSSVQIINSLNTSGLNRRVAATSAIEVAISNDLAWFRQYAVLWNMQKGPFFILSSDITQTSYTFDSTNIVYDRPPGCNSTSMATRFQKDAASSTNFLPPNDEAPDPINSSPNPVPNGASETTIALPKSASGYSLKRTIQPDSSVPGVLTITYSLTNPNFKPPQIFTRSNSLYLPAAGWCP